MFINIKKICLFFFVLICVIGICLALIPNVIPSFSQNKQYTVVLDAGHGAPDGGAVGASGTEEKDINLSIVLKLREILESRGIKTVLTRQDDNGIYDDDAKTLHEMKVSDMKNRLKIINNSNADLFISVHMNSFTDSESNGLHIFYARNHPEIEETAKRMQDEIAAVTNAETHTVKTASETLFLMKNPTPPAILAECGFISNPAEEKLLNTEEYQAKIAFAIAKAVLRDAK